MSSRLLAALGMTVATSLTLAVPVNRVAAQATAPAPPSVRSKGSVTAPMTVYEMSDFQCPYCKRFALETFPTLEREYVATGKVRWVFINFPLTSIHPNAVPAAELSLCASRQSAFWPIHDLLYAHQDTWAPLKEPAAFFVSLADSAKISKPELLQCLTSKEARGQVQADAESAERSGATSTPTFYIEGGLLTGAHPVEVFRTVLDSIYKTKTSD